MEKRKRTIDMLLEVLQDDVWMYLKNMETCRRFYEDAEAEGFMFGHIKPTVSPPDDIIVVHKDRTLGHPGYCGHMAFNLGIMVDDRIRIDYAKYMTGADDFYIRSKEDLK